MLKYWLFSLFLQIYLANHYFIDLRNFVIEVFFDFKNFLWTMFVSLRGKLQAAVASCFNFVIKKTVCYNHLWQFQSEYKALSHLGQELSYIDQYFHLTLLEPSFKFVWWPRGKGDCTPSIEKALWSVWSKFF